MAKIYGNIATINNNHTIKVSIYNKNLSAPDINIDASHTVKFSAEPVEITQQQDNTFEHILKTQCKIRLVTKEWLGDYLFAANYSSIVVNVWVDNHCVFCGYVTPHTYNQSYAHQWEEVEINCVDILSTLKDRRLTDNTTYEELVAQSTTRPFSWFLGNMDLDTTTVVIPNFPDIDYGEAEMAWYEVSWTRVVNQDDSIDYYGIEAEVVILDDDTAMNTGNERQGELKTVTWIESTDTCIVDGVSYYKEYAHITVAGEDVNTGDWRVGSNAGGMPEVVSTRNEVDGWTTGVLPQPFDFWEHYTTYNIYDNGMEIAASDGIGEQIPESPNTTTAGSYYEFRQGSSDDVDIDEDTGYIYYKDYAWVCVNNECTNSGQWQRGQKVANISGKMVQNPINNGALPKLNIDGTRYNYEYDSTTREFVYYVPISAMQNMTTCFFEEVNYSTCLPNVEELYFNNFDTSHVTQFGHYVGGMLPTFSGMCDYMSSLTTVDLSDIDTSQMINMRKMFSGCNSLTSLDVSNFVTSNVKDMSSMFGGCSSLQTLDVSNFDTSSVIYETNSFYGMYYMFAGCSSLIMLDVSNFDMSNVHYIKGMFADCSSLAVLNLSTWNLVENNVSYDNLFRGCTALSYITLDDAPQSTFNVITSALLNEGLTSVIIYRDGNTYVYDSNSNTWIIQ